MRAVMLMVGLALALACGRPQAHAGSPGVSGDSAGGPGQAPQGQAPRGQAPMGHAGVTILTNPDSALVAIDGLLSGSSPLVIDSLGSGRHLLVITRRDTANWLEDPLADTVELAPGEHRGLKYTLEASDALSSVPSGATVSIGGIPAGTTPMVVRSKEGIPVQPVTLSLEGYEPVQVNLTPASGGALQVSLRRLWSANQGEERGSMATLLPGKPGPARLYISGLAAVAAGAVAAYFKIQADDRNDVYMQTGDPAIRSQVHKYDTISALSLTVAQIGMGLFAYFLLSE